MLRILTPYLAKQGKVVVISGVTSTQLMPSCSTLGVLRSMCLAQEKSLSFKLGPKGINMSTISPGDVLTDDAIARMYPKAASNNKLFEAQYSESVSNVPLRNYAQPQDINNVVEFFLSDKSNDLTGTNLICDSGFTQFILMNESTIVRSYLTKKDPIQLIFPCTVYKHLIRLTMCGTIYGSTVMKTFKGCNTYFLPYSKHLYTEIMVKENPDIRQRFLSDIISLTFYRSKE